MVLITLLLLLIITMNSLYIDTFYEEDYKIIFDNNKVVSASICFNQWFKES